MPFHITPRGPFDLATQSAYFGGWPTTPEGDPVVAFPVEGWAESAAVVVRQAENGAITASVHGDKHAERAWEQAQAALSLDVDGTAWPDIGHRDPVIGKLQSELGFLRPVLFHSPYEAAAAFVIGHRISIAQGRAIRTRMAEQHGDGFNIGGTVFHAFPRPEQLRRLREFPGLSAEKVERLHGVADAALAGWLDRATLRSLPPEEALAKIKTIRGIGDFFAEGILTRGAGLADWHSSDAKTRAAIALAYRPSGAGPSDEEVTAAWRPLRMWACVLLNVWVRRSKAVQPKPR